MENSIKEKTCVFYASDYHFEMISLPFIEKNLEGNKEVIILTENNLENTVKNLIKNVNLKEEKKERLSNINWKNDDENKFEQIKNNIENKKDTVVFIKGKENYIKNTNNNIQQWAGSDNLKVIDCYDMDEIGEKINNITSNYSNILSTTGERSLENKCY